MSTLDQKWSPLGQSLCSGLDKDAPPWVTTTRARRDVLESWQHRQNAESYFERFLESIRHYWENLSKAELKKLHRSKPHPRLYDEEFIQKALDEFLVVTTNYDFRLDQREWEDYDNETFLAKEIFPLVNSIGCDATTIESVPLLSSPSALDSLWPTGTYMRYAQNVWLSASWNVVPALPDHMLSLAGYVLVSSARNLAPLLPEERLEFMQIEWRHNASARDRSFFGGEGSVITDTEGRILSPRPDISAKESVRIGTLLDKAPFSTYLPFVDVDCSDKVKGFDPTESPKRAVAHAVAGHAFMKGILGSVKWKLSNERGGLHGVPGILPPSIESTDLLLALAWKIEQECAKVGVPTIATVDRELDEREDAEILDTTPYNKKARGRGGMYRTPGCVKTDQEGREKPGSVAQEPVENHVENLPWLAPLTTDQVGEPEDDFSSLPQILADFRCSNEASLVKERKTRNLRPGEVPVRPQMARPKLELGGEALLRTVEAIKKNHVTRKLHRMRVCLSGLLLFRHGIPAQATIATLVEAFPGAPTDAIRCVEDTLRKIQGGADHIAGKGALSKIVGKDGINEIEEAIRSDEQERIDTEMVNPIEEDDLLEAYEVQTELRAAEEAENTLRRQEAADAMAEREALERAAEAESAGGPDEKPPGAAKPPAPPKDDPLTSILSYPDTFWDPRDKDVKRGYFTHLIAFIEKNADAPRVEWTKFAWGFAGHCVQSGIARGVVYRSLLKAKIDNGDNVWDSNKQKIKNQENGVGGVWTIRRALKDRLYRHYIEALAKDLAELEAPHEVRLLALRGSALVEKERFTLDSILAMKRQGVLKRRDAAHGLETLLRCEVFGARHDCVAHGKEVCYLSYVCKKDQCRHCRYHREKAKRTLLRRLWPHNEKWLIAKIPLPDGPARWTESVEIGDDGMPRKRAKKGEPKRKKGKTKNTPKESTLLRDRVRQSYYQHPFVSKKTHPKDRWPKKLPHKAVMGFDHALVVTPASWSEEGEPADENAIASFMEGWRGDVELVSRDEAIDRIITHQYTVGEAFDLFILTEGEPVSGYEEEDVLSWLAKGTKTIGGNKAGQVHLPWPNATALQAFLMEQAELARKHLKVKMGECPVLTERKNPETGEKELVPCAMKCRVDTEKTATGEVLATNSGGHVMTGREVWKLADKRGMLLVENQELAGWTYTIRGDAQRMAQKKRQLAAAFRPPR